MELDIKKLREEFKEPHHLITTSDDQILFLRIWEPSNPSNVGILIFHGITGYSGPYQMFGIALSKIGYAVYGLDLRGHGLSDGNRGDYPSKERLIKDLGETISFLKQKHEKLIIFGHSMGVLTAFIAIKYYKDQISGLILLSAARTPKPGVYKKIPATKKLKILFNSIIKPSKPAISYFRDGMTGLDDPLYNFNYTFRYMRIFNAKKLSFSENLNMPIILGVGENDEIFTVESARSLYDEIPSDNKEFIVLPGAKHAEFPEDCWKELINWLISNFQLKN
ncbi:MAG: alpha/beta hydrolase [Candidatus Hodarchaeota archaeon]